MKERILLDTRCILPIVLMAAAGAGEAQDFSVLRINEVIAENDTQLPRDIAGSTTDMVEIFNTGAVPLDLGHADPSRSLGLSDGVDPSLASTFGSDTIVPPGGSIVVFCDGNRGQGGCDHVGFRIASDGSEPISLWGPVTGADERGNPIRGLIDQVWLPPLPSDASFGRFPDGAGPAPVPLDRVLDTFVFYPPGASTFGACTDDPCDSRRCPGAPNRPGGNLEPRVTLETYSTASPAGGEPVRLRARASDERDPGPPGLAAVEIVYRVDGGAEQVAAMTYDSAAGRQHASIEDFGSIIENPFRWWTFWDGEIPGQPAGSRVELHLRARDSLGAEDTTPDTICEEGVGPCDRQFGGPWCELEPGATTCANSVPVAVWKSCRNRLTYAVAFEPRDAVAGLVINEVVSKQFQVLGDPCCQKDFIEIHNSSEEDLDLSGLFLSSNAFNPLEWAFPPGSQIAAGQYLIVWLDGDGGACPGPAVPIQNRPCFWRCPDPTDASRGEYHTSFTLDASGDEVYLFAGREQGFGVIHAVRFGDIGANRSLALLPDGDRSGCWVAGEPSPGAPNPGECTEAAFVRGDADATCSLEITDAVFTLLFLFQDGKDPACLDAADADDNGAVEITDAVFSLGYLFLGSTAPPPPGIDSPGRDPTPDDVSCLGGPDC